MGFVEEEHKLRKIHLSNLRKGGVKLREQPQEEGGIKLRLKHEAVCGQHIHDALSALALQEVIDVKVRFPEEFVRALVLKGKEGPLDSANRGRRHIAVLCGVLRGVLPHEVEHGPKVLEVNEKKPVVVCDPENYIEDTGLGFVEVHQAPQHLRAHTRNGGTHGMSLLSVNVKKAHGAALELGILYAELRQSLLNEPGQPPSLRNTAEVPLHVGHEAGHARLAEGFGEDLKGDGFTCAGGSGYESVAASHFALYGDGAVGRMGYIKPALTVKHKRKLNFR